MSDPCVNVEEPSRTDCVHNPCPPRDLSRAVDDPAMRQSTILQIATRVSAIYSSHLRDDVRSAALEAMCMVDLRGTYSPSGMLYRVARRAAYHEAKRERRHMHEPEDAVPEPAHDPSSTIHEALQLGAMRMQVITALPTLKPMGAACVAGAMTGRTTRQLACELGLGRQAVSEAQRAALLELGLML